MRGILRVAGWTWATLALANVPYGLYPAALLYGLGIVALARRYGKRLTFWTSLLANPYAWLALVFAAGGILGPNDAMKLGLAIGSASLALLALGVGALAVMVWSSNPLLAAAAALTWAVTWPSEMLFFGPGISVALPLGLVLLYLSWPWRDQPQRS